jgi:hypothetical protein
MLVTRTLVPLCRMARAWKNKWDVKIGGLLIDTLAYQFIENYQYRDKSFLYYDFMCRDFFQWMSDQSETQGIGRRQEAARTSTVRACSSTKPSGVTTSLAKPSRTNRQARSRMVCEAEVEGCFWNSIPGLTTRPNRAGPRRSAARAIRARGLFPQDIREVR